MKRIVIAFALTVILLFLVSCQGGKLDYEVKEVSASGEGYEADGASELVITSVAEYSKFVSVKVDGEIVDPKNYTVEEGSTRIIFKPEFLATLSSGEHTFTIVSTDGEANTKLTFVPHEHKFGEWSTVKEASCTDDGAEERYCTCGEKESRTIPAKGHVEVNDEDVEPTCTEEGSTGGTHCSVCNAVIKVPEKIAAKGHVPVDGPFIEPTCTEDGMTAGKKCSVCGAVLEEQKRIPKKGHVEVKDPGKAPTCTEEGISEGSHCSVCGTVIKAQEKIAAKGHTEGNWVIDKKATCSRTGTRHVNCTVCGATLKTETIPKTDHDWKDATCFKPKTCKICGATEGEPRKGGHVYENHECIYCGAPEVTITFSPSAFPQVLWYNDDAGHQHSSVKLSNVSWIMGMMEYQDGTFTWMLSLKFDIEKVSSENDQYDYITDVIGFGWTLTDSKGNEITDHGWTSLQIEQDMKIGEKKTGVTSWLWGRPVKGEHYTLTFHDFSPTYTYG